MSLDEFRKVRIEKLKRLRDAGMDPYPIRTDRSHRIIEAVDGFDALSSTGQELALAGRVMALRTHGGLTFIDLDDGSATLQVLFKEDNIGAAAYALLLDTVDVGDFIQSSGKLFLTKRGERTLEAKNWRMLAKGIRPLPEKW